MLSEKAICLLSIIILNGPLVLAGNTTTGGGECIPGTPNFCACIDGCTDGQGGCMMDSECHGGLHCRPMDDSGEIKMCAEAARGYYWLGGVALAILGSVCSNLGVNVQKYSFIKEAEKGERERVVYWKNTLWLSGLGLVIVGSLGDFAALGMAAQSIVAPIGAVTLVANMFFAHYWLKERLTRNDLMGTVMIIGGSTISVVFGNHIDVTYTVEDLKRFYQQPGFIVYGFAMITLLGGFYTLLRTVLDPLRDHLNEEIALYEKALTEKAGDDMRVHDHNISVLEEKYKKWEKFHPFTLCALSGIFGGQNILFGKMVAVLLGKTFAGDNQMTHGLTYVFLICMFSTIFLQLRFLAKALSLFDALYVVPVFQCFFITISTIGGAAYFKEFSAFTVTKAIAFPFGLCVTLYGVKVLSSRDMTLKKADSTSDIEGLTGLELERIPEDPEDATHNDEGDHYPAVPSTDDQGSAATRSGGKRFQGNKKRVPSEDHEGKDPLHSRSDSRNGRSYGQGLSSPSGNGPTSAESDDTHSNANNEGDDTRSEPDPFAATGAVHLKKQLSFEGGDHSPMLDKDSAHGSIKRKKKEVVGSSSMNSPQAPPETLSSNPTFSNATTDEERRAAYATSRYARNRLSMRLSTSLPVEPHMPFANSNSNSPHSASGHIPSQPGSAGHSPRNLARRSSLSTNQDDQHYANPLSQPLPTMPMFPRLFSGRGSMFIPTPATNVSTNAQPPTSP